MLPIDCLTSTILSSLITDRHHCEAPQGGKCFPCANNFSDHTHSSSKAHWEASGSGNSSHLLTPQQATVVINWRRKYPCRPREGTLCQRPTIARDEKTLLISTPNPGYLIIKPALLYIHNPSLKNHNIWYEASMICTNYFRARLTCRARRKLPSQIALAKIYYHLKHKHIKTQEHWHNVY